MPETRWMLHDGSFRAAIWPFSSREQAESWSRRHGMTAFVAAPLVDGLEVPVGPAPDAGQSQHAAAGEPPRFGRERRKGERRGRPQAPHGAR